VPGSSAAALQLFIRPKAKGGFASALAFSLTLLALFGHAWHGDKKVRPAKEFYAFEALRRNREEQGISVPIYIFFYVFNVERASYSRARGVLQS